MGNVLAAAGPGTVDERIHEIAAQLRAGPVHALIDASPPLQVFRISGRLFPAEQQRIVRLLIDKVIVSPNDIEVRFRPNGIEVLALDLRPELVPETVEEAVA